MSKKDIVKELEDLEVKFDPKAPVSELENILAAAKKEAGATKPETGPVDLPKEKLKDYGPGLKCLKVTHAEMEAMRPELVGYKPNKEDPYSGGIAIIKG